MARFDDPLGLGHRQARMSEEEMAERMLDTALAMAAETGLRVNFDLHRLEDVIVRAGVSRSAVYKRWPRKEQFYSEVLLRLAGSVHPALAAYDAGTVEVAADVGLEHLDWFETPVGRHRLLVEMCRLGALHNFTELRERPDWHVYMALHATLLALPDNDFRAAMREALAKSEAGFMQRMTMFYAQMLPLLGYRFRPEVGDLSNPEFAALGAAIVEGLVLTSNATPMLKERRFDIDPFNTGHKQDWSFPALGFTSMALALVEPDPSSAWDSTRVAGIKEALLKIREIDG